jgi:formate hydrogenlyase subunit 6/NADH:ubiquinone oxidoreductase subunit I
MMPMNELPVLDDTRCTNCGDCVVICPTDCLEASMPIPWLPRPHDCIACSLCALICPVEAIRMEKTLVVDKTAAEHD